LQREVLKGRGNFLKIGKLSWNLRRLGWRTSFLKERGINWYPWGPRLKRREQGKKGDALKLSKG